MKKIIFVLVGIFGLALLGIVVAAILGLSKKEETGDKFPPIEEKFRKGVSYSPYNVLASADFWIMAKEAGEVVRSGGDWLDFGGEGKISRVIVGLARQNGLVPVIEVNFFNQDTGELLRPLNEANRTAYINEAVEFAEKYEPPYFGIGVEIDTFYRRNPKEFDNFVSLFNETYDAVKAVSPDTKIFTTFQLERTKGLGGGIFGGKNDTSKNNWNLLAKFAKADLLAFSTYPGLIYKDPADIPADYYTSIRKYTSKPIAFTEIGWASSAGIKGWESSEVEQKKFVTRFFQLTSGIEEIELAIWIHLYEQTSQEPFGSMALGKSDGALKPAWDTWVSALR